MANNYEFFPQEDTARLTGTSKQGSITATFAQLEELLGVPAFEGKGDNVTTEFVVDWSDVDGDEFGTFSLYDWSYCRNFANDYEEIVWNIGGTNYNDVMAVDVLMEKIVRPKMHFESRSLVSER